MTYRYFIFLICVLCLFSGCASTKADKASVLQRQAYMWSRQTSEMDVQEAFINGTEIFLKFQILIVDTDQPKVFYGRSRWDPVYDLTRNLVVPIELMNQKKWEQMAKGETLKVINENHWADFERHLIHAIVPSISFQAVSIRNDELEMVFYTDQDGQLMIKDIKDKPADVPIIRALNQEQLSDVIVTSLGEFLRKNGQKTEKILLTMTQTDFNQNLFMFADFKEHVAVGFKIDDSFAKKYQNNVFRKGMKTADYLILNSHVLGLMQRPLSSSYRLFSWSGSTAYDVMTPDIRGIKETPIPELNSGEPMSLEDFEARLDTIVGSEKLDGKMEFLIGGDKFFPKLIDALLAAQESIDIRIFIFDNDDYGVEIADILKKKSNEGVKVRVLLDSMGQIMGEGKISETLPAGFVPPKSMVKYLKRKSKIDVRIRPSAWFKADHTKTIVIDGKTGFTGGMNIGREYRYDWHDLMLEVQGPILQQITYDFNLAWAHASAWGDLAYLTSILKKPEIKSTGQGYPIRMLYTKINDSQIFKAQLEAIKSTKKYIYINNAYFSDNAILAELIKARRRGVDVRVILPINGNHEIMNASNVVTANVMFKNGIRVYFYPGMSHIKAAVYDGWLTTGSANFDKLSFRDNLELNLATSHKETVDQCIQQLFMPDFEKSKEMEEPLESGFKDFFASILAEQL